MNFK
jgi:hypothetical protein